MARKRNIHTSCSGQAMAELLIGLVAIVLLVVGLQQVSLLSQNSFKAYFDARSQLAEQVADPMSDFSGEFIFVDTVTRGNDSKAYTADDQILLGDDSFYTEGDGFLHAVDYASLNTYLLDQGVGDNQLDPYYRLSDSSFSVLSESFSMYFAEAEQSVDMLPVLRKALGTDSITLKQKMFMPSWRGLMEEP